MSLSLYIDNKCWDILTVGEGPTQWLDDTVLAAEVKWPINFAQPRKKLVYATMEAVVSYLLVLQENINSKQKTLK